MDDVGAAIDLAPDGTEPVRPGCTEVGPPSNPPARPRATATAAVVAVGLVAWAAAVDPWGFRPFTTLRWAVLAVVVLVAAIVGWRDRPPLPRALRLLGLAFLAWLALATAFAVDPVTAWLGHPQRHLGLLAWVLVVLAFRVGTIIGTDGARRAVARGAVVAALVVAAGVALDLVGIDVAGSATGAFGARAGGWFGQPAYLGAAGVLLVPLAVGAAGREVGAWRIAAWAGAGAGVVAVLASQTRGAWLGLLVAAVVAWPGIRPRTRSARIALLGGVVALAVCALVTPLGGRAVAAFDLEDGTSRGRLDEWRVAVSVVAEHPLTGVGPEGYRIVVPEHLDDDYARRYGRAVFVDRAHDGVLDVAVIGGLPAAALYVALVALVLARVGRARRSGDPIVLAAAAAVAGFVVQQLVLFPAAELDPLAWLLAGVLVAATGASVAPGDAPAGAAGQLGGAGPPWSRVTGATTVVALGVVLGGVVVLGGLDLAADRELAAAVRERDRGDHRAALAAADRATQRRPDDIDTWYVAADVAASGESLVDVDAALDRIEAGLERSPQDPALLDRHEQLLVERALRSDLAADLDRAAAASGARIEADPSNAAHHRRLGLVLAARGDRPGASAALDRALDLDPDDAAARAARDRLLAAP